MEGQTWSSLWFFATHPKIRRSGYPQAVLRKKKMKKKSMQMFWRTKFLQKKEKYANFFEERSLLKDNPPLSPLTPPGLNDASEYLQWQNILLNLILHQWY